MQQAGIATASFDRLVRTGQQGLVFQPCSAGERVSVGAVASWTVITSALAYLVWHVVSAL